MHVLRLQHTYSSSDNCNCNRAYTWKEDDGFIAPTAKIPCVHWCILRHPPFHWGAKKLSSFRSSVGVYSWSRSDPRKPEGKIREPSNFRPKREGERGEGGRERRHISKCCLPLAAAPSSLALSFPPFHTHVHVRRRRRGAIESVTGGFFRSITPLYLSSSS